MKRQIEGVAEQLLDCAAKEFLDKGFADASLREIAKQCGVSTHSIYTRFQDKAGLFDAVVEQTLKDIEDLKRSFYERNYKRLDDHTLIQMWDMSLETHQYWINYFYDRFEDMKLLLCSAQGSHHGDFLHDFVAENTKVCAKFVEEARNRDLPHNDISEKELHLLLTAYWTTIFEPIIHDFSRQEALEHCKYVCQFFNWQAIFGF